MTSKTAADGDDYTWQAPGVAVLNGTCSAGLEATQYNLASVDLRTPDQKLKEVTLRCDTLVDELQALTWRVAALEQGMTTLRLSLERIFEIRL